VFLDRDGTMVHDTGYLSRLEELRWYPFTVDAIRLLNRAGFLVFVTTNQGGVGLGFYPESFVHQVHEIMHETLTTAGAEVHGWFYCPHHPRATIESLRVECACRKPLTGMIRQAQAKFDIDLPRSFVVGDKMTDLGLAQAAGAQGIMVRTGHGEAEIARLGGAVPGAALIADDLMAATAWMLDRVAVDEVAGGRGTGGGRTGGGRVFRPGVTE
jgi:D-glycero-D-manno-heptose 1,7-bisphosphate phosphatase